MDTFISYLDEVEEMGSIKIGALIALTFLIVSIFILIVLFVTHSSENFFPICISANFMFIIILLAVMMRLGNRWNELSEEIN